jgi:hypothetical protein
MNKIAGPCTRDRFSSLAPANFADARKNVRDRLLFSVMMNSCPGPRFHLEQPAPDGGRDTERRRDRGTTLGTRRLRCCQIELRRPDDVDCSRRAHGVPYQFGSSIFNRGIMQWLIAEPVNCGLVLRVELRRSAWRILRIARIITTAPAASRFKTHEVVPSPRGSKTSW